LHRERAGALASAMFHADKALQTPALPGGNSRYRIFVMLRGIRSSAR